jgi:hypothetical protein
MSKLLRAVIVSATLGLASVAAMAGGHVTWSVGVNLPPAQVVVGNGQGYYHAPQTVYYQPAPVYHQPAPVYYSPPQVVYRPVPVYGAPPAAFGGWVHDRPSHWHRGHGGHHRHGGHHGGHYGSERHWDGR